jgi:hypothetical protein
MPKCKLLSVIAVILVSGLITQNYAQTALTRKQLGNATEGMTYVRTGPMAGTVVVLDSYQVLAVKENSTRRLFSTVPLPVNVGPRGITFIENEQKFVLDDATQVNTLFLADPRGRLVGTLPINYLNGYVPDWIEGLAWLPGSSTLYPNHLLLVAINLTSFETRIEVIRRDGQVVAEILPQIVLPDGQFIVSVAYERSGTLLTGASDGTLWRMDFQGRPLAGPGTIPNETSFEGVAQISEEKIAVVSVTAGQVSFVDATFLPLPIPPWSYKAGYGLSTPIGIAWNPRGEFLVLAPGTYAPSTPQVASLTPWYGFNKQVIDLSADPNARRLTFMSDERLIAISHANCGGSPEGCYIGLFNEAGALVEKVPMPYGFPSITYISPLHQFAEVHGGSTAIEIFARNGDPIRTIVLSGIGIDTVYGLTYFNPSHSSGGEFLIIGSNLSHTAFVTDFNGNLISTFDYKQTLGAMEATDVATVASLPFGNVFVLVEAGGEIVTFYLPK